jgi:hypothetical protein
MGTVGADKTHRGHAIIEQVHADLKATSVIGDEPGGAGEVECDHCEYEPGAVRGEHPRG